MERKTRNMPLLVKIAAHWAEHAEGVFPNAVKLAATWTWREPFCFRCGWFAPTPDLTDADLTEFRAWRYARGWLERAHLHDRWLGGTDDPANIVPLCVLCHYHAPQVVEDPQQAIDYINRFDLADVHTGWQAVTDMFYSGVNHAGPPGIRHLTKMRIHLDDQIRRAVAEGTYPGYPKSVRGGIPLTRQAATPEPVHT